MLEEAEIRRYELTWGGWRIRFEEAAIAPVVSRSHPPAASDPHPWNFGRATLKRALDTCTSEFRAWIEGAARRQTTASIRLVDGQGRLLDRWTLTGPYVISVRFAGPGEGQRCAEQLDALELGAARLAREYDAESND